MISEENQGRTLTREEMRKRKKSARKEIKQSKKDDILEKKMKEARKRLIPIWLRLVIVAILSALALAAGLMIGYGVIGDGNPTDALDSDTWQHIKDIIFKEK